MAKNLRFHSEKRLGCKECVCSFVTISRIHSFNLNRDMVLCIISD